MDNAVSAAAVPGIFLLAGLTVLFVRYLPYQVKPPFASFFYLVLMGLFLVYLPMEDAIAGLKEYYGYRLNFSPDINHRISLIYSISVIGYLLGNAICWKVLRWYLKPNAQSPGIPSLGNNRILYLFQIIIWLLYFLNLYFSGISVIGVFNPFHQHEQEILFAADYRYPFIELLAASVPVALFIQLRSGETGRLLWWLFFAFWLLLSLLGGWRFRIILFVLFFIFHLLSKVELRKILLIWAIPISIAMAWLTLNRMAIAKRQFNLITFDLRQFDAELFNHEFSNSRTFRACMSLPAWNSFPGIAGWMKNPISKKPRLLEFSKSWIPPGWPWNPNPALSQPEEFFLLFGFTGLFAAMFLVGIYTCVLDHLGNSLLAGSLRMVLTGLLFQWFSRGYFPFQLKITFICLLPFLLLWLMNSYLSFQRNADKT